MKKTRIIFIAAIMLNSLTAYCQINNKQLKQLQLVSKIMGDDGTLKEDESFKDIDGNIYNTINVNGTIWMTENLKVSRYNNGDPISYVEDKEEWIKSDSLKNGMCCMYDNNQENENIAGRLYNYYSIIDKRKIAPKGWHIATIDEWHRLIKSQTQLSGSNNGTPYYVLNSFFRSNFNLVTTTGLRTDTFIGGDRACVFWTLGNKNTANCANPPITWIQSQNGKSICMFYDNMGDFSSTVGFSIRCVKDTPKNTIRATKKIANKK